MPNAPTTARRDRGRLVNAATVALAVVAAVTLAACSGSSKPDYRALSTPPPTGPSASPGRPNIVFVLTDDLSTNLVQYMPHVIALEHNGMSFTNYTVTDSLCCPSRASIFTGNFPHDTHVLTNVGSTGGAAKFRTEHDDQSTFATSLSSAGYRTAFMGKYLNGYNPLRQSILSDRLGHGAYVPPGWSTWNAIGAGGYSGYNYVMADGHSFVKYGSKPSDFANTVLQKRAVDFIRSTASAPNPFLLEVATFSPHTPFVPAPADRGTFTGLPAPRTPAYDRLPSPTPAWMRGRPPLTAADNAQIENIFQKRVEDVQSVDRMIAALEHAVQTVGQARNTIFVFSSDNGFHLGEYTLESGKQTAFDTDIRVPLVIAGPGIAPDTTSDAVVENIDLRPTFDALGGVSTPFNVDGANLLPLLHGEHPPWRTVAAIEHHHPYATSLDPDSQSAKQGIPPTYNAIRTAKWIYVRYVGGDREYYDLATDPYELHNLGPTLPPARVSALDRILNRLINCHDQTACWRAGMGGTG